MPIIRNSTAWKSVKYENEETAADDEFQYLAAFEELNDYELIEEKTDRKKKRPKTGEKRKRERIISGSSDQADASGIKKKKKKKTKTKFVNVEEEETGSNKERSTEFNEETEQQTECDMSEWETLYIPEPVLQALKDLNFSEPTEIQKLTMPPAIRDRLDILGAAETGSGKTLAFGIPIIAGLLADESSNDTDIESTPGPKALILSPTRELALQIKEHLIAILKFTDLKVACVVGGLSVQKQQRLLKKRPEILIATPGRLWALISEGFDYVKHLDQSVQYLAIDETDRMVEKGHFMELSSILDFVRKDPVATQKRQTFVFSATLTYVHPPPKRLVTAKQAKQMTQQDKIGMLVALTGLRKQRKVIDVTRQYGTAEGLTETRINCSNLLEKDTCLYYFLANYPGRTLIFTNSIDCSRRLRSLLIHLRLEPLILHAQMHQKQRLKNLERFSEKEGTVLLATDVASRGLDIKNIEHVIHYQVPRTTEIYVHRSGRTARAHQKGLSIMLVDGLDVGHYRRICKNLNRDKDLDVFPVEHKVLQMAKMRVELATRLESMEHKNKREQVKEKWFERAAREAELGSDDDDKSTSSKSENIDARKEMQSLQRQLNSLLNVSIKKQLPVTKYPSAYQLDATSAVEAKSSDHVKGAIEVVNDAQKEGKRLLKKLGARGIIGRVSKAKIKGKNGKGKRKS